MQEKLEKLENDLWFIRTLRSQDRGQTIKKTYKGASKLFRETLTHFWFVKIKDFKFIIP